MERVAKIINEVYAHKNSQVMNDGEVLLLEEIPRTKPTQYCFELFRPLTDEEINQAADSYRNPFPKPLKDFYRLTNGAFLFGRCISIYGMPLWEAKYKQPVALAFADGHRTDGCPKERLFFACYNTDPQIQLFFDTREEGDSMHVYAARYGKNDVIAEWPSFADWFISEHAKYAEKYKTGDYEIIDIVKGILTEIEFQVDF